METDSRTLPTEDIRGDEDPGRGGGRLDGCPHGFTTQVRIGVGGRRWIFTCPGEKWDTIDTDPNSGSEVFISPDRYEEGRLPDPGRGSSVRGLTGGVEDVVCWTLVD